MEFNIDTIYFTHLDNHFQIKIIPCDNNILPIELDQNEDMSNIPTRSISDIIQYMIEKNIYGRSFIANYFNSIDNDYLYLSYNSKI